MTNPHRILLVRLSALGDVVHALPVAATLRKMFPNAQIDWVVDERYQEILEFVPIINKSIVFSTRRTSAWRGMFEVIRSLRRGNYDIAIDVQGLVKSAFLARASRARRVVGFPWAHLRERAARFFYTEVYDPGNASHVIEKGLRLVTSLGVPNARGARVSFPIEVPPSIVPDQVRKELRIGANARFVLLNPGAAWPNKRWPAERFGAVADWLQRRHGLPSVVLWGPGDEDRATRVVSASGGTAHLAPRTSIADLLALFQSATLMISGDTGPLHIAAALGTPVVGIYGPTSETRNGPWSPEDVTVSRFSTCSCNYRRECYAREWCLANISVVEITSAIDRRLASL